MVAFLVLAAFLAGSIPFGYLVVRLFYRRDIRTLGSGNVGMTNVWRNFGWAPGLGTLLLDLAKGYLPVLGVRSLLSSGLVSAWGGIEIILSAIAVAAIAGHAFTPWLGFRGGKGVATSLGAFIALVGAWVLVPLAGFALAFAVFRYVSLGSLTAGAAFLAATIFAPSLRNYIPLGVVVFVFVLYTHRENIGRLVRGREPKFRI